VEQLWRKDSFAADIPFTNAMLVPMGVADTGRLYETIATIVARHGALRSRLAVQSGRAVQIAEDWKASRLEVAQVRREDLTDMRPGRVSAVSEFSAGAMDLYAQDGFRCQAFRDEQGEVTLGLLAHGFFADAWSSQILLREIRAVHAALGDGTVCDLPPVQQYADYARALRTSLAEKLPSHLAYWFDKLKDSGPAAFPYDRDGDTGRRGRSFFFLDQEIAERLSIVARESRVSLMILLLGAYHLALARWSGTLDILSAAYTADRVRAEFQNTVGMLVTNMPVRARIDPGADLGSFLFDLSRDYYGGYAHREIACELYDAIFAPDAPFCASVFNFVPLQKNFSDSDLFVVPAFTGTLISSDASRPAIYREIYLGLSQHSNGMLAKVFYNAGHFSPDAIENFIQDFRSVAHAIARAPSAKLKTLLARD
jgi:hypothetical protein